MDNLMRDFRYALTDENGYAVAACITPEPPKADPGRLYALVRSFNEFSLQNDLRYALVYNSDLPLSKAEGGAWVEVFTAYWKAVAIILDVEEHENQGKPEDARWDRLYDAWKELVNQLIRGFTNGAFPAWQIPTLYVGGKYLRVFAVKADEHAKVKNGGIIPNESLQDDCVDGQRKNEYLEDAGRQMNRIFTCCVSDRSPIDDSRKWGIYYVANLMFRIHFKLNSTSLSKNIIRTIQSLSDLPAFEVFPKSHQVTFNYYAGVIYFLDEDYTKAEEHLIAAWTLCHKLAHKNRERVPSRKAAHVLAGANLTRRLILNYLIPCHLLTSSALPSSELLSKYPQLDSLFRPLCTAIKRADLAAFDAALDAGEHEFVKRRIYLTLERGRDVTLRNLFCRVFIAGGFDPLKPGQTEADRVRRSRVPVSEFTAAVRLSLGQKDDEAIEPDEVECMISTMIYKNLMKGYISHEHGIVVLNKKGAFPGTGV